jgi:redox-sensing transcriptional repressor
VERLSIYRRALGTLDDGAAPSIFSHDLARLCGCSNPAQVRRDLMTIGAVGTPSRGYDTAELRRTIDQFLGPTAARAIALIGVGNLGRALIDYIHRHDDRLSIAAAFDRDETKSGRVVQGVRCYPVEDIPRIVQEQGIGIAILAIPETGAQAVVDRLVTSGVRAILNFAPVSLRVPSGVRVEDIDITVALDKLAFSARTG